MSRTVGKGLSLSRAASASGNFHQEIPAQPVLGAGRGGVQTQLMV